MKVQSSNDDTVEIAYLGLGGNVGEQAEIVIQFQRAMQLLEGDGACRVLKGSSVYHTPAWGVVDQPDFLNAVAKIQTCLDPIALLAKCKDIERQLGRQTRERWGPREIDIDILLFGRKSYDGAELTLPHPGLLVRAFAWVPLLEIAPDATLPDGAKVAEEVDRIGSDSAAIQAIPLTFWPASE